MIGLGTSSARAAASSLGITLCHFGELSVAPPCVAAAAGVSPDAGVRTSVIIGVDVGGTTTAVGLVTRDGEVIADASAPTRASSRDPLDTIVGLIGKITERAGGSARSIAAVGIGVPGPVDAERGIVGEPVTHIPALEGRALASGARRARRLAGLRSTTTSTRSRWARRPSAPGGAQARSSSCRWGRASAPGSCSRAGSCRVPRGSAVSWVTRR